MSLPASIVLGVHIFAAAVLLSAAYQALFAKRLAVLPKGVVWGMVLMLFLSGLNNMMYRIGQGVPKQWHMWFGVKFLLALHILAMLIITATSNKTDEQKRGLLAGAGVSSIAVILISVFLNYVASH